MNNVDVERTRRAKLPKVYRKFLRKRAFPGIRNVLRIRVSSRIISSIRVRTFFRRDADDEEPSERNRIALAKIDRATRVHLARCFPSSRFSLFLALRRETSDERASLARRQGCFWEQDDVSGRSALADIEARFRYRKGRRARAKFDAATTRLLPFHPLPPSPCPFHRRTRALPYWHV